MDIRSLFLESEMIFWRHGSEVTDHGDHIVIKTARNPTWRWGNLLLFPNPPVAGDHLRWNNMHDEHFGPEALHRLFVWDTTKGEPGAIESFIDLGFQFTTQPLLRATELQSIVRSNKLVKTRPITVADWADVVRLNQAAFGEGNEGYALFIERKFELYRSMVQERHGLWMGAWEEETLVASCGIFHNDTITRYQEVMTAETHRNNGICTRLVYDAYRMAQDLGYPARTLIAVDSDSQAERIYSRLGFENCEMTCALRKSPT